MSISIYVDARGFFVYGVLYRNRRLGVIALERALAGWGSMGDNSEGVRQAGYWRFTFWERLS